MSLPGEEAAHQKRKRFRQTQLFLTALRYLWYPRDNLCVSRLRVLLSLICLALVKAADLAGPILLKISIDALSASPARVEIWAIVAYGAARLVSSLIGSLRDIFFSSVSAECERTAALELFTHLQKLSLEFHLKRKTGSVIRSVSRGASSFSTVLRIVLFQLLPILIQIVIVCVFLLLNYQWWFAVLTSGIMILYFVYTMITTEWRNKYRRVMNEKDNEFNQKAVDALINFETVKYFNAENHEINRYDQALREYSVANSISQQTLAVLNTGQEFVISAGVTGGRRGHGLFF